MVAHHTLHGYLRSHNLPPPLSRKDDLVGILGERGGGESIHGAVQLSFSFSQRKFPVLRRANPFTLEARFAISMAVFALLTGKTVVARLS